MHSVEPSRTDDYFSLRPCDSAKPLVIPNYPTKYRSFVKHLSHPNSPNPPPRTRTNQHNARAMASATTLAEQGLKAFTISNYPEAISLYSQALAINPEAPDYYVKRSIAYQRSAQYELALRDAELAVFLAHRRGKRELIGTAQLRRAIALHLLGRYGDAGFCFSEAGSRCATVTEKNMIGVWKRKLEMVLEKLDEDDVTREVTVTAIPQVEVPKAQTKVVGSTTEKGKEKLPVGGGGATSSNASSASTSPTTAASAVAVAAPPQQPVIGASTPSDKIRHEWYQTPTLVVLTLYAKHVPKDKASIDINSKTVCPPPFVLQ